MSLFKPRLTTIFTNITKGVVPAMDPVTATQNAIVAFLTFGSTPAGQQILEALLKMDIGLINKIGDLFNHLHSHVMATPKVG